MIVLGLMRPGPDDNFLIFIMGLLFTIQCKIEAVADSGVLQCACDKFTSRLSKRAYGQCDLICASATM